jgi:sec-independent protein translocase protein TatB
MFDIGFWELITIALIAILIVRPENLPKFADDAGKFVGKLRNFIFSAKKELERELKIEEINDLRDSINQVDKLMHDAPDRKILKKTSNKKN